MAIINVLKMGDPKLLLQAEKITDFNHPHLHTDIGNMIDTMRHYNGVGLAAPQIGLSIRVIVLEVFQNPRYSKTDNIELTVLINPEISHFSDQTEKGWEGCLSVPGLRGRITRSQSIIYQAYNEQGELIKAEAHGFHARIIQHEIDHLDGVLYPQRLEDPREFGFEDSLPDF